VKVFGKADEFARELSAVHRLGADGLEVARSAQAMGMARAADGDGGVLVSSLAEGRAIDTMMQSTAKASGPERTAQLAELKEALAKNAEAFAELHTAPAGSGGQVATEFLDRHVRSIYEITQKLQSMSDRLAAAGLDMDQVRQKVDELTDAFRRNPGDSALVHGDAHPGNFFYDPATGITMIDTPTLHFSMDASGNPIGAPARDIANFQQKIAHFGRQYGLTAAEIDELQKAFRDAYGRSGGARLTDESMKFFRARTALGELLKTAGAGGEGATARMTPEALMTQIQLLEEALGQ
jgi:aminoglycoside phosphotransferase (APT) family kinase protein